MLELAMTSSRRDQIPAVVIELTAKPPLPSSRENSDPHLDLRAIAIDWKNAGDTRAKAGLKSGQAQE
jgi:hypothetical protein